MYRGIDASSRQCQSIVSRYSELIFPGIVASRQCKNTSGEIAGSASGYIRDNQRPQLTLFVADLEAALKVEPGNINIEDELARLVWAEKKAKVQICIQNSMTDTVDRITH